MSDPTTPAAAPDPAELARWIEQRRVKANRATRGVLAALLCLEAIIVLLVPRAIAQTSTGLDTTKTVLLVALAVVLVLAGGCCGGRGGSGSARCCSCSCWRPGSSNR